MAAAATDADRGVSSVHGGGGMSTDLTGDVHIVLVTCVKTKGTRPAAARDLYTSALFRKERAYAERAGVPWFILSAEHGLVAPDEWLAPYERYLTDTPVSYRSAWGGWVAARLDLLAGPLSDKVVEVHAGSTYLDAIRPTWKGLSCMVRRWTRCLVANQPGKSR